MSNRYIGGFLTNSPVQPTTSSAVGIWTLTQQSQAKGNAIWPTYSTGPTVIGQAFGGGFYAGQIGEGGVATHYLIVGPVASAQNASKQWKTTNTSTGVTSVIDGPTNSATMNNASHPAAQFCEGLTIGGFSDWYMPAKNELDVCYFNLKPTTYASATGIGINANAIPARASNYTSVNPAQTSSADFKDTGTEDFSPNIYWSSTEYTVSGATGAGWVQNFGNGNQYNNTKTYSDRVRAIRRIAV